MLATRLDCLIGSELSEPSRAELTLTERISCSVRLGSLPSLQVLSRAHNLMKMFDESICYFFFELRAT